MFIHPYTPFKIFRRSHLPVLSFPAKLVVGMLRQVALRSPATISYFVADSRLRACLAAHLHSLSSAEKVARQMDTSLTVGKASAEATELITKTEADMNKFIEKIPAWALPAIINDDPSGLADEDIELVNNYCRRNNVALVHPINDDIEAELLPYFDPHPAFGFACDVVDCIVLCDAG
jgi:hypothetical protein